MFGGVDAFGIGIWERFAVRALGSAVELRVRAVLGRAGLGFRVV